MRHSVEVTCQRCGEDVEYVTIGKATESGGRIVAIFRCIACRWQWIVTTTMRTFSGSELEGAA